MSWALSSVPLGPHPKPHTHPWLSIAMRGSWTPMFRKHNQHHPTSTLNPLLFWFFWTLESRKHCWGGNRLNLGIQGRPTFQSWCFHHDQHYYEDNGACHKMSLKLVNLGLPLKPLSVVQIESQRGLRKQHTSTNQHHRIVPPQVLLALWAGPYLSEGSKAQAIGCSEIILHFVLWDSACFLEMVIPLTYS